jgi:hypothetical protein
LIEKKYPPTDQSEYFIHPPKVAGTAIAQSLGIKRTHDSARFIKLAVGKRWDAVKIFGGIRNPWDRALSWFMYNTKFRMRYDKTREDFNRWIREGMDQEYAMRLEDDPRLLHQEDFIEIEDQCVLGFTIRFERLYEDWNDLLAWLGRPSTTMLITNDKESGENKPDYREWFDQASIIQTTDAFGYFAEKYGYSYGDEPGHVLRARRVKAVINIMKKGVTENEVQGSEL